MAENLEAKRPPSQRSTMPSSDGGAMTLPGIDPKAPRDYVQFKCLPPGGPLNRWSTNLTHEHDFPGARAMLYGAGVPDRETMEKAAHEHRHGLVGGQPVQVSRHRVGEASWARLPGRRWRVGDGEGERSTLILWGEGGAANRLATCPVLPIKYPLARVWPDHQGSGRERRHAGLTVQHGMRYSLQSRELIADSVETVTAA